MQGYYLINTETPEESKLLDLKMIQDNGCTYRLYKWEDPSVSLGRDQKSDMTGKHVSVRLTRGNALWVDKDVILLSVVVPSQLAGIKEVVREINLLLTTELGPTVRLSVGGIKDTHKSMECFNTRGKYELEVGDKKLVGSAIAHIEDSYLLHNIVYVKPTYTKLEELVDKDGVYAGRKCCLQELGLTAEDYIGAIRRVMKDVLGGIDEFDSKK